MGTINNSNKQITIALVGKITDSYDSYSKVEESVFHSRDFLKIDVDILWVDSSKVDRTNVEESINGADGIILLGGFGENGVEGMIETAKYARENNIPLLGICLGMQVIVIEFARNVLGYKNATSTEFNEKTGHPVVDKTPEKRKDNNAMRKGCYLCDIVKDSLAHHIYEREITEEVFRHGYEFNNLYKEQYEDKGLSFTGSLNGSYAVEIVEFPQNEFYLGVQFHPEFRSSSTKPHPLFTRLIQKCLDNKK